MLESTLATTAIITTGTLTPADNADEEGLDATLVKVLKYTAAEGNKDEDINADLAF